MSRYLSTPSFWPAVEDLKRSLADSSARQAVDELASVLRLYGERLQFDDLDSSLRLGPGSGWVNSAGTATQTQPNLQLGYWEFLDNNATDTIELTLPLLDDWAGRTLHAVELTWATDGTSTSTMVYQLVIADYIAGTDLANSSGNASFPWVTGAVTLTPTGTAHQVTRTSTANSTGTGAFNVGADDMRVLFRRQSDHASDTNADGLRLYGVRLRIE